MVLDKTLESPLDCKEIQPVREAALAWASLAQRFPAGRVRKRTEVRVRSEYTGGHWRGFSCDAGGLRAWDSGVTGSGLC